MKNDKCVSTLAADTALARLVETAKLRWRIERDYQELKQELGWRSVRIGGSAGSKTVG
jgi:SRSO17 transposase